MTCPDLERRIDESDLCRRNRLVLKAYTRHVNPPTAKRSAPDHFIVWPSMEDLMDVTAYSLDTIRYAKRELLAQGILEPVPGEGPWRRHTPRYRINPEKIQQDAAVIERQIARRQRRRSPPPPHTPTDEKSMKNPYPLPEKGMKNPYPLSAKGYGKSLPEVSSTKERDPDKTNFFGDAAEPTPTVPEKKEESRSRAKPQTKTPAPDDLPLTEADETWIAAKLQGFTEVVGVTPQQAVDEWLDDCRAKHYAWPDWPLEMRSRLRKRYHQAMNHGPRPGHLPRDPVAARVRASRLAAAVEAPPTPVTCSWGGCSAPPCGHGPQTCRSHGWGGCPGCLAAVEPDPAEPQPEAEVVAEAPGIVTTLEPPRHPVEASAVTGDVTTVTPEAEGIPVSALEGLAHAFAGSHRVPTANPRAGPLGSPPPRRRVDGGLGDDGDTLEQDADYLARMAARKAELRAQALRLARAEAARRAPVEALAAD